MKTILLPWRPTLSALLVGSLLAGCGSAPIRQNKPQLVMTPTLKSSQQGQQQAQQPVKGPSEPTPGTDGFPAASSIPANILQTPNAVPHIEPKSASGNPSSYKVFGKVYHVRDKAKGFVQEGYASWYGRKFQGRLTASGERYNMFKMTAAHKTLPIPCYAQVTDLANGRSVVVRINDRGPFHSHRIIDLSYAAAARLGMLKRGSTRVRLRVLTQEQPQTRLASADPTPTHADSARQIDTAYHPPDAATHRDAGLYLQVGAFSDPINAVSLRDRLLNQGVGPLELRSETHENISATRVLVGPFSNERSRQAMREHLQARKISSQPVKR